MSDRTTINKQLIGDKGIASIVFGVMFLLLCIVVPLAIWSDAPEVIYWIIGAGGFLALVTLMMNLNVSYERKTHVIVQKGNGVPVYQSVVDGQVVTQQMPPQVYYPYPQQAPGYPQMPAPGPVHQAPGQNVAKLTAKSFQQTAKALPKPLSYTEARAKWRK